MNINMGERSGQEVERQFFYLKRWTSPPSPPRLKMPLSHIIVAARTAVFRPVSDITFDRSYI